MQDERNDTEVLEARRDLFRDGIIAAWYLRDSQIDIYEHILSVEDPFIECSRRFGKTTTLLAYTLELLIQNPKTHCLWVLPEKHQARLIVLPELEKIQSNAHSDDRFIWNTVDSYFKHPNGSKLFLRGVNGGNAESARGLFADIIILDESGSIDDANYVINDILRPTLLTTGGPLISASTPSRDLDHPYYEMRKEAIRTGRFIQKTIHDNESLTKEQIEKACHEVGGETSSTWRREYLCEPVADTESLVIPEFNQSFVHEYDYPETADSYVGIDLGFNDFTAAVMGFYDWRAATLVITHEVLEKAKNSHEIVESFKKAEKELHFPIYKRVSDNDLQLLHDMRSLYGYAVNAVQKDDKLAAVNLLRTRFQEGKIVIHPRCKSLIHQLTVGMWKNPRDFMRSESTGHLDLIDALIYLNRSLNLTRKPELYIPLKQDEIRVEFSQPAKGIAGEMSRRRPWTQKIR